MAGDDKRRPTDAELAILNVLWERGPCTVRKAHEALSAGRDTRYTTTLKLLQIMAAKGLVGRDESSRAHVYRAAEPKGRTLRQLAGSLLERAFGGSAEKLVLSALEARKVSAKEIQGIRKLLDDYESGRVSRQEGGR